MPVSAKMIDDDPKLGKILTNGSMTDAARDAIYGRSCGCSDLDAADLMAMPASYGGLWAAGQLKPSPA